jgi:hypothetical protein
MKDKYCDKCFKKIKKPKDHKEWCPYYIDEDKTVQDLKNMFNIK